MLRFAFAIVPCWSKRAACDFAGSAKYNWLASCINIPASCSVDISSSLTTPSAAFRTPQPLFDPSFRRYETLINLSNIVPHSNLPILPKQQWHPSATSSPWPPPSWLQHWLTLLSRPLLSRHATLKTSPSTPPAPRATKPSTASSSPSTAASKQTATTSQATYTTMKASPSPLQTTTICS